MAHFSIASRASSRTLSALAVLAMAAIPTGAVALPISHHPHPCGKRDHHCCHHPFSHPLSHRAQH